MDISLALGTAIIGVYFTSVALIGYFAEPLNLSRRCGFIFVGILLLLPHDLADWGIWTDILGILIGGLVVIPSLSMTRELGGRKIK